MGLADASFTGFLNWVLSLQEKLAIPHSLAAINIDESRRKTVARMAVADPSAGGSPISFSQEQYSDIFIAAVYGTV